MTNMIRVLLADDQALIRAGFRVLLDSAQDIEVVGEAEDGRQAVAIASASPRRRGADGHPHAGRRRPGGHPAASRADEDLAGVKVLILTTFEDRRERLPGAAGRRQRLPGQGR